MSRPVIVAFKASTTALVAAMTSTSRPSSTPGIAGAVTA
jgi:hypothetical protein